MCRFVYYQGEPIRLGELLTEPAHSLIHQSWHSHERSEPLNGDGFGVGWYVDGAMLERTSDAALHAARGTTDSEAFFALLWDAWNEQEIGSENRMSVLVSSEPLTPDQDWQPIGVGDFLVISDRQVVEAKAIALG